MQFRASWATCFYLGLRDLSEFFFLCSFLEIDILFLEIEINFKVEFSSVISRFSQLQVTENLTQSILSKKAMYCLNNHKIQV